LGLDKYLISIKVTVTANIPTLPSCKCNAVYETYGSKLTITAINIILQGQSISLNYLEPYLPQQEHQSSLSFHYKFECICDYCQPEARDIVRAFLCKKCDSGVVCPTGNGLDITSWTCGKCSKGIAPERFKETMELEAAIKAKDLADVPVNDLLEGGVFHQSHYLIQRALDHRVRLLSRLRPQLCERLVLILLENTERVLPKYHPDKAVYFDLLGQIRKLMGDLQGCREAFTEAYNIREKSCGKSSPLTSYAKAKAANPEKVEINLWYPS